MKVFFYLLAVSMTGAFISGCGEKSPIYKDPEQRIEKRVEDLLDRMTLLEKVAQMMAVRMQLVALDAQLLRQLVAGLHRSFGGLSNLPVRLWSGGRGHFAPR